MDTRVIPPNPDRSGLPLRPTYWITRYALTRGLIEVQDALVVGCADGDPSVQYVTAERVDYMIGVDAWATREEAGAKIVRMQARQIVRNMGSTPRTR